MRRPTPRDQKGAVSVEFAIVVPALVLIIGLLVAAGRLAHARVAVQQWADSAARTASIARDAGSARSRAHTVVSSDAAQTGVRCGGGWSLDLDAGAFALPAGRAGAVGATVRCPVPLADLVPGLPGSILVEGHASSTLDRYRGRR